MLASLRKFRFPASAGVHRRRCQECSWWCNVFHLGIFSTPTRCAISYLCKKSAQGAKSCLHVFIQLCGIGGFFFGLFSCIGQTFCTKHKVNGMTSPVQNPRFRLYKQSFVIYWAMVALGHRYVVVCMSFMAQLRCVVYSTLGRNPIIFSTSSVYAGVESWGWLSCSGLGIIRCTGVEFKVCGRHHESNLCKLFIFSEARMKPHSQ